MVKPNWTIILILWLIVSTHASTNFNFKRHDPIVWLKTNNFVETGLYEFDILYTYVNPCDALLVEEANQTNQFRAKLFRQVFERCNKTYTETWLPEIENLLNIQNPHNVYRRIALTAIVTTIVFGLITSNLLTTVRQYSDHQEVKSLGQLLELQQLELAKFELDMYNVTQQTNNMLVKSINQILKKIDKIEKSVIDVASLLPEVSWETSQVYLKMHMTAMDLRAVANSLEKGTVDLKAFGRLINSSDKFRNFDSTDTRFVSLKKG